MSRDLLFISAAMQLVPHCMRLRCKRYCMPLGNKKRILLAQSRSTARAQTLISISARPVIAEPVHDQLLVSDAHALRILSIIDQRYTVQHT